MCATRVLVCLTLFAALNLQFSTSFAAPRLTQVAAGSHFSLFIMSDGSLWGVGDNSEGQLGIGSVVNSTNVPVQIVSSGVTAAAAGNAHTLFRMSNGSLWAMGNDFYGQLGDGASAVTKYVPEQIVSSQVTVIGAGGDHSLFGEFHFPGGPGSLWAMGFNEQGELGDGTTTSTNTPQEILSLSVFGSPAVTAVAGGYYHSLFIRPGGSLWAMGDNFYGELGDGTNTAQKVPEQIVASNVVAIAAALERSLFIKSDGSLWGMGDNFYGELGDGTNTAQKLPEQIVGSNVVAIAAGELHSLFLKSDGSLWGMGQNGSGQLGLGPAVSYTNVPVQIVPDNVVAIAAGSLHSLFIKSDGSLWAMGDNSAAQLGDPRIPTNSTSRPIQILPPIPLLNGGFETGNFANWTTNGNVSQTAISTKSLYVHSGRYGAQLGPIGSLGYLSQTLLTAPGANYALSFWLDSPDAATPNEFHVSWNGTTIFDVTNLPAIGWTNIVLAVTATGAQSVLQFAFRNDNSYFGLDDISVALVPPTITGIALAGSNLVLQGSNGQAGGTYITLTSTNLALALSQWTPVATNVLNSSGNFTFTATNAIGSSAMQQFFILQEQ